MELFIKKTEVCSVCMSVVGKCEGRRFDTKPGFWAQQKAKP